MSFDYGATIYILIHAIGPINFFFFIFSLWNFTNLYLKVWNILKYFFKWFIIHFNFIHENIQWRIFIPGWLFNCFLVIKIILPKSVKKNIYKDKNFILRKKMFKSFKIKNVIDVTIKHHLPMDGIHP